MTTTSTAGQEMAAAATMHTAWAHEGTVRRLARFSGSVWEIGIDVARELQSAGIALVTSQGDVHLTALGSELTQAAIANELVTVEVASPVKVRITDEDGETECTLEDFLRSNATLDEEEVRSLRAGDRVALGGGAAPLVFVEVCR